jgi:type I restriction enzyme S subunit
VSVIDTCDLPAGWAWASLDQVCASITDGDHQPPPQVESGVPFLVIGNVRDGRIDFSDTRFVSEGYFNSLVEHRRPARGDVLYSVTGSFGIPVLVTTDRSFCVQRHIAILRPSSEKLSGYLARALGTAAVFRQASNVATGTAQKTVGLKHLRQFTVPVAPLPEQERIVEAIESYFTRLDDAVATLERVQRNLKRYRASVLKAAVEGRLVPTEAELARAEGREYEPASVFLDRILAERRRRWQEAGGRGKYSEPVAPDTSGLPELPEGWCYASLPQLGELNRGQSKHRPRNDPRLLGGPYPFIQTGDVRNAAGVITSYEATYSEFGLAQSRLWPAGALCITIAANIAETGILRFDACFPDSVVGFLQDDPLITRYVEFFIRTAREKLAQYAPATAQKNINLQTLSELVVPLPPAAEQARIVAEVDRQFSVASYCHEVALKGGARCVRLRQSILKWAFEGRLADQDPSDEPATGLLERIRSQTLASRLSVGDTEDRRLRRGGTRKSVQAENKP